MNYVGHTVTNLAVGTGVVLAAIYYAQPPLPLLASFAGAYFLATFFLSPDLDLHYSSPTRNWKFFRVVWYPYSLLFRHRGLSHSVLFGSLTRIAYLSLFVFATLTILDWLNLRPFTMESIFDAMVEHKLFVLAFACGVAFSDFVHIVIGDRVLTALKYLIFGKR